MPLVVTGDHNAADDGSSRMSSRKHLRRSQTVAITPATDGNQNHIRPRTSSTTKRAARHVSQSLTELVTCSICLDQLRRPTMLPCQHTFCLTCLQNCVLPGVLSITCPTCRIDVDIPQQGVGGLPTNIALQAFLESIKDSSKSSEAGLRCNRCLTTCSAKIVCQHCDQMFCSNCQLIHNNEMKIKCTCLIDDLYAEEQRLSLLPEDYKSRYEKLQQHIAVTCELRIQKMIQEKNRLDDELKQWQLEETTKSTQAREKCIEMLSTVFKGNNQSDNQIIIKKESIDQVVSLLENVRLLGSRLTFNDEEFLLFRESEEDGATTITAPNQQQCNQDKNANQPIESASKRQVAFAVSDDCNQAADSQQTTNVALRKVEASSSADEQSFFYRCKASSPKFRFTSSYLQRPAGVAVSPWTKEIYVAGTDSHRVYVMDKNGKITKSLGSTYRSACDTGRSNGAAKGHFLCPFGIAFSISNEEIYVTDKWLHCIQVFGKEGNYLRQIGAKGTSAGHFRSPEGIAVDAEGLIYVCDTCNDRVQVLNKDGVFVREVGLVSQMNLPDGKLYQRREFNEPTGVAVSADGSKIAICDFGNCRIKVFDSTGAKICVFGFRGSQRGQFEQPECIAMDDKGFILVGDNGNGRIQIFRPNGNFVRALGTKGTGVDQFSWISGIALTNEMDIIATDFKNHCVQIF